MMTMRRSFCIKISLAVPDVLRNDIHTLECPEAWKVRDGVASPWSNARERIRWGIPSWEVFYSINA
jgi:hypothetical protein